MLTQRPRKQTQINALGDECDSGKPSKKVEAGIAVIREMTD